MGLHLRDETDISGPDTTGVTTDIKGVSTEGGLNDAQPSSKP